MSPSSPAPPPLQVEVVYASVVNQDQISTGKEARPGPRGVKERRIEIEDAVLAGVSMPPGGLRRNSKEPAKQHPGFHSTGAFKPRYRPGWDQDRQGSPPLQDHDQARQVRPPQSPGSSWVQVPEDHQGWLRGATGPEVEANQEETQAEGVEDE